MNIKIVDSGAGYFQFSTAANPGVVFVPSQMTAIVEYFEKFLVEEQFDTVVEIGTYKGGLTIVLDEIKQKHGLKFELYTSDIGIWNEADFGEVLQAFKTRSINFNKIDTFSEAGESYLRGLIQDSSKKVCVLCDGGDKIREFNYFSNHIKQGDFIMAHDYSHNSEGIDGLSYDCPWNWQEIKYTDISETVKSNNLQMNLNVRFPEVAWACYRRV